MDHRVRLQWGSNKGASTAEIGDVLEGEKTMAQKGWSKSTFEVLANNGKRWVIDMSSPHRDDAMEYAEKLLATGKYDGVRVTELREGWSSERVVFEKTNLGREKPLRIFPEPQAEFCTTLNDYYALPARLTMGRILRAYLDQNALSMMELLFHAGHLRSLDRMDKFFPSAIQHGAQLQAKLTGQTKIERLDKLQTVFDKVLARARKSADLAAYAEFLEHDNLDHAIALIERDVSPKQVERTIYGMLANHIEGCGWREKFKRAIVLAETSVDARSIALADELVAEILDGKAAIEELFGGFSTPVDAWKTYVAIISGRFTKAPGYMSPDIVRLNELFNFHPMTATRQVLLRRVSKGLGSTQAFSKDGREKDRSDFVGLLRGLVEPTGLSGGPYMAEAMILRAKTLLGEDGDDLPIDTAIRQALYLMPSQAVRLGVLLDLTSSELGQKHEVAIRQQLLHLLDALRSIYDLFPEDVHEDERTHGIDALRERLGMSILGEDIKTSLSASLGKMVTDKSKKPQPKSEPQPKPQLKSQSEKAPSPSEQTEGELALAPGQVLFEEGEEGKAAYLVLDGVLEVSRILGDEARHLATLGRGEIVGEMALIDHQPRMASVKAVTAAKLMCISEKSLSDRMSKLAENDQVLHFLLKTVVRRLRGLARNTE